jgi:ATP-dependent DNA ligase
MLSWLGRNLPQNEHTQLAPQERLPIGTEAAQARLNERLTEVLAGGGEGLIIRRANSLWLPERSHDVLKYKPDNDAEGVVTGYIWGRRTDKGSKLLGLMGALISASTVSGSS